MPSRLRSPPSSNHRPRRGSLARSLVWVLLVLAASACNEDSRPPWATGPTATATPTDTGTSTDVVAALDVVAVVEPLVPAAPQLRRLNQAQYRQAIADWFGGEVVVPAGLEPDVASDGLFSIGAGVASVSRRGVEQYFQAARAIAKQVTEDADALAAFLPCEPTGADDASCHRQTAQLWGPRLWRRPLTSEEVETLVSIATKASDVLETFAGGSEYLLAAMLTSPGFLYAPELGEADPSGSADDRRLTDWELATRLSLFLWNTVPDDTLLAAAAAGELTTAAGLAAQVDRLLASDRSRAGVRNFFSDWLGLHELDRMQKDPNVFTHYSTELGGMAREETLRVVEHHIFDLGADYRALFTTRKTFVNRRLAAIYDIPAPADEGFAATEFPADGTRAGIVGHVSFLALHAHPTASSATKRGLTVRETLLCGHVPSPPSGFNTAIPEPSADALTVRDRLVVHMEDPTCGGCHSLMDPIGFGLERFDGLGRFRTMENGGVIDPSGELDSLTFQDARSLAEAIANHPNLPGCFVESLFGYATGHAAQEGEDPLIDRLTTGFVEGGHDVRSLLRAIALSEGFAKVGPVPTEPAEDPQ